MVYDGIPANVFLAEVCRALAGESPQGRFSVPWLLPGSRLCIEEL